MSENVLSALLVELIAFKVHIVWENQVWDFLYIKVLFV